MPDLDRIQRDKATILAIIKYTLFALIAAAVIYFGMQLFWILIPFVISFIMARVASRLSTLWFDMVFKIRIRRQRRAAKGTTPLQQPEQGEKLPRRKHGIYPQGLARSKKEIRLAVAFYVFEVAALIALVVGVIIGAIRQFRALAEYLPALIRDQNLIQRIVDYLNSLSDKMGGLFQADFIASVQAELAAMQARLIQQVPNIAAGILNSVAAFAAYLPILVFIIIVVIMSGFYFITDSRRFYIFLRRNITSKVFREKSIRLVNSLSTTLFRVVGGYLFLLIITFIEALVGLLIIRMPYAVIIALIAAIIDFLPVFGISVTLIPVSIYMFVTGNIFGGLGALVLIAVITFVRRAVEPAVVGNAMRLHPMAALASMIIGIGLYGLVGIIIGPVILVVAKEILSLFGLDDKLRKIFGDVLNKVSS